MIDLSSYSLADLRKLKEQVADEMRTRQAQEVDKARAQIEEIARNVGVPLSELLGKGMKAAAKGKGGTVAVRYQHPDDAEKRWSGRGRQPQWVKDWIESNKPLADLDVAKAA